MFFKISVCRLNEKMLKTKISSYPESKSLNTFKWKDKYMIFQNF